MTKIMLHSVDEDCVTRSQLDIEVRLFCQLFLIDLAIVPVSNYNFVVCTKLSAEICRCCIIVKMKSDKAKNISGQTT